MNIVAKLTRAIKTRIANRNLYVALNRKGKVDKHVMLSIFGEFTFGNNIKISSKGLEPFIGSKIQVLNSASLSIGNDVGMTQVSIICKNKITIGDFVKIGAGTMIIDSNFHNLDWKIRRNHDLDLETSKSLPVKIGNDVFIGTRSLICKGVSIGDRSIIAAGSVVVNDIPDDCIAGGNPCRVIKTLV